MSVSYSPQASQINMQDASSGSLVGSVESLRLPEERIKGVVTFLPTKGGGTEIAMARDRDMWVALANDDTWYSRWGRCP